jgi:hypothetical protein
MNGIQFVSTGAHQLARYATSVLAVVTTLLSLSVGYTPSSHNWRPRWASW